LGGDELQYVHGVHLSRLLADHGEEHLQVEAGGQHTIRSATCPHETEIVVELLMAETDLNP
jgi:hypothetical protein